MCAEMKMLQVEEQGLVFRDNKKTNSHWMIS